MKEKPVTMLGDYIDLDKLPTAPKGRPAVAGFATGVDSLDEALDGIRNELIAVASRPGVGKTAFLLFVAEALASKGIPGVFFTLEHKGPELANRALAHSRDYGATKALPIIVEDALSGISDIAARLHELKQEGLAQWAMIDYLALMRANDETKPAKDQCGEIVTGLAALRTEVEIPILFAVQLPRGAEGRAPRIEDSSICGTLSKVCDSVIVLSDLTQPQQNRNWRYIKLTVTNRDARSTRSTMLQLRARTRNGMCQD